MTLIVSPSVRPRNATDLPTAVVARAYGVGVQNTGGPLPGLWLVAVRLDRMSGLTVVEIDVDDSVRVLGGEDGMYLFPTRQGLADFLASGEPHSLQDVLDGSDVISADPEYDADFVALMEDPDMCRSDAATLWMQCLLVVDACGIEDPPTVEYAMARVAAVTTYRDDFERPEYEERDYWMGRQIRPVRLTLPSGSGVTLVALPEILTRNASPQPFLGDYGHVVLFRDPADLLAYVRADGTDEMRASKWWPDDAPNCEPVLTVDVRAADPRAWTADAFDFLRGLALVLIKRFDDFQPHKMTNDRRIRKEVDRFQAVLREVNGKVTWR
jgi:hypothetical protein